MLPDELLEDAARRFALLGDPTRLRLVRELHASGELTVGALAARAGTTLANASQHLLRLAADGVVGRRRAGKSVVYRIVDPRLEQLCDVACASIRERAQSRPAA
jgi:DNA-binding transcriptional ArsR family regulator